MPVCIINLDHVSEIAKYFRYSKEKCYVFAMKFRRFHANYEIRLKIREIISMQITSVRTNTHAVLSTPSDECCLQAMIGHTPLLAIELEWRSARLTIYAKAEFLNLTGSVKDRMAFSIISRARADGQLAPGQPIVEVTSGNAGIALAALGSALGHPVIILMPDWMSLERRGLLTGYGAQLLLVSREQGGFLGALARSEDYARQHGAFLTRQFANEANVIAHAKTTGPEIISQMGQLGVVPDAFVAGVGTGGTVMGVAAAFAAAKINSRVHPVEPLESPTLSTGFKIGQHRIQGISDDFIPEIVKLDKLDAPLAVSDSCAIRMAQRLSRELGLGVGISSGANFLAALAVVAREGPDAAVATVFCDNSLRYLSTALACEEPARPDSVVDEVRFCSVRAIRSTVAP
jgi:cysteine synthase